MASELRDLNDIRVSFTPGKPFYPYEQLLAVQPASSCTLLPEPYQYLMTSPTSPIRDFYPVKFDIDMEGKRAEWEGIVKIPFISEDRLLAAARSVKQEALTSEERRRNAHGDVLVFQHVAGRHEAEHCESTLPRWGATVHHAHSSCRHVPPPPPLPPAQLGFRPALVKGTLTGKKNPPGFPTLKTMKLVGAELKMAGVTVFGNPSKKESLILTLPDIHQVLGESTDASAVSSMIGERVYVKWPYLQEAQIVRVSDKSQDLSATGARQMPKEEADNWANLSSRTRNVFLTKQGVETGPLPVMLHVKACTGYVRHADGSVVKRYKDEEAPYPLQARTPPRPHPLAAPGAAGAAFLARRRGAVLRQRPRPPAGFHDPDEPRPIDLQEGVRVLFLGQEHYGCVATLLPDPGRGVDAHGRRLLGLSAGGAPGARACVRVAPARHDAAGAAKRGRQVVREYPIQYMPSGVAARALRVNPRLLGRVTGNVWVGDGDNRVDVGLAVKNAKQGLCVPGLAAPLHDDSGWAYSQPLLDLVAEYRRRFPWVLSTLESSSEHRLTAEMLVPASVAATASERSAKLSEVTSWLKGLPTAKRPLVKTGVQIASDKALEILLATMPPLLPRGAGSFLPVDYENVAAPLLLPPYDPSRPLSALLGGQLEHTAKIGLPVPGTPVCQSPSQ
ncbi:5'-3' exoribonuclease 1 [Monoraphidium neglectum]|uniref:5'-3' exoribonuclease 1 n=1 Tax=Monoraphidium neglectum TaxID=145388 RepID=A0A0D2J9A3_9CHLO|nr:5'-3' exoribonuclease 1 [Monoraphidium neglectum]KIY96312.1 5'-3' exoribonuclease 1 [Monoraphidium neglectum]|eukprot:XP_013895332.1 5'-3' exoribonuclease 1 [Monoraphidium neglectum]